MTTLWLVKIHEDDWDYDRFEAAAVWADTAEEAEQIMRREVQYPDGSGHGDPWIDSPDWKLVVEPAPTEGVAFAYFHAG